MAEIENEEKTRCGRGDRRAEMKAYDKRTAATETKRLYVTPQIALRN